MAVSGWPKWDGNAQNTSLGKGSGAQPVLRWINSTLGGGPIIGPDGTVYVAGSASAALVAINGETGTTRWTSSMTSKGPVMPALGLVGALYGGDKTTNTLYSIDSITGALDWLGPTTGAYTPIAVGKNGNLYSSYYPGGNQNNGYLYALDPNSGAVKWSFQLPISVVVQFTPSVDVDGTIYIECSNQYVYALNPQDGSLKWKFTSAIANSKNCFFVDSISIGPDGTLYVPYAGNDGFIIALSNSTGQANWTYENQWIRSGLALGPNHIGYLTLQDVYDFTAKISPTLCALDTQSGAVVWTTEVTNDFVLTPAIGADGTVYVGELVAPTDTTPFYEGIYAYDGAHGALLWNYSLPFGVEITGDGLAAGQNFGSVAIADDGSICFGTQAGVYCLDSIHIASFSISPTTVLGGTGSTGTITLSAPAPTGGSLITFSESSTAAGLPTSLIVPAGQTTVSFPITTTSVSAKTVVQIQAFPGTQQIVNLTVNPPALSGLGLNPTAVVGGSPSTGTVTLGTPAGPSGLVVDLASGNSAATVPSTVTVAASQTSATFTVTTTGVDSVTPALITATLGSNSLGQTLTVNPGALVSVVLNPTSVQGGATSTGTVTLSGPAGPSGATVVLASSSSSATLPASVTVAAGQTNATFAVATTPVGSQVQSVITGTLSKVSQTATLTINPATLVSVTLNPTSVLGGNASTGTVTLSGAAPTGGTSVALSSGNSSATVPNSVLVPAGQTTATFTVSTTPVAAQTSAVITATLNKLPQTATLTITPEVLLSVTLSPTSVLGGASSTGTVTLSAPSPAGGTSVSLMSGNAAATVPSSVTVAAGQTTATFTVTTTGVNTQTLAVITATLNNKPQTATLTISAVSLTSLSLSPTSVQGGTPSTGTVTLSGPAGTGGTTIALSSSTPAAVVPTSVTVPSGQTSATFKVATLGVNAQTTAIITGNLSGTTATANLTITAVGLKSFSVSPTTVYGGNSSTGTITLNGPAAIGGSTVALGSSSSSVNPPGSVTIAQGQTSGTFQIQTSPVASTVAATVTANLNGTTSSALLTVTAPVLQSLTISPSTLAGAGTATGTVTFSGVAPASGITVNLLSSSPSATVPSTVTVPSGQSSASFSISAISVSAATSVTISATANFVSKTATLTLNPIELISLTLNPSTVNGGSSSTGTLSLNGPAGKGGLVVHLKSSLVGVTVPATATIPLGQTSVTFKATTVGVSSQKVATITATLGAVTETATLTVNPPVLSGISLTPSTVTGSQTSTATVTLSGAAPSTGIVVKLTCSSTNASVPVSVTIPSGKSSATFTVKTIVVPAQSSASISAALNGVTETATLTINPPTVLSLTLSPASVKGGSNSTGKVTLNAAAPKGGLVVTLSAGQSDATVPASATVAAGATSATFTIKTGKVTAKTTATISATATGTTKSAVLAITP